LYRLTIREYSSSSTEFAAFSPGIPISASLEINSLLVIPSSLAIS